MKLTNRGNTVAVIAFSFFMLTVMGVAGAIETQEMVNCGDYESSQDWKSAYENDCPFTDESGNYLYTWKANS